MKTKYQDSAPTATGNGSAQLDAQVIRKQLDRILLTSRFIESVQLGAFLRFVVEETLAGRQEQIKQYTVAVKALGFGTDFNPQENPAVRVQAHRLRRALDRYYESRGRLDSLRIEIPKGGYVPSFHLIDTGSHAAPEHQSTLAQHSTRIDEQPEHAGCPSIAVLPFVTFSDNVDVDQEFFAEGLSEELSLSLSGFQDLAVVAYYSCRAFKDKPVDIRQVGDELGADLIVTGSVRDSTGVVRIITALNDVTTGQHVWADKFERDLTATGPFAVQDEIVQQIVGEVTRKMGWYRAPGLELSRNNGH